MDQRRIKRGSTWINVDQVPSACSFSLQLVAAVLTHGSCVMAHGSCVMRPTLQASCVPRVRRQAHGSCVPLTWHASDSWLMRPTHVACVPLTWHASHSRVRRQASDSWLMRPASGVRRPASGVRRPRPSFSTIQPPPVVGHDDNRRRHFPHATPFRFAPIELYGMG